MKKIIFKSITLYLLGVLLFSTWYTHLYTEFSTSIIIGNLMAAGNIFWPFTLIPKLRSWLFKRD